MNNPRPLILLALVLLACVAGVSPALTPATVPATAPATRVAGVLPAFDEPAIGQGDAGLQTTTTQPDIHESMRELWRASIQAPQEKDSPAALEQAVQALQAVQATGRPKRAEPKAVAAATAASAPATSSRPAADPKALQAELVAKLKALPATAALDRVELADALYQAGQFAPALALYEQALPASQDKPASSQPKSQTQSKPAQVEAADLPAVDKGWLLYQAANCRLRLDDAATLPAYKRVLVECPDSTWAALAAAQAKLLEWYQAEKPQALAEKARSQGTGAQKPPP